MKRYADDYGREFHCHTNRRPLTRQEAARVIATPLPKRASGHRWPIAGWLASGRGFDIALAIVWALLVLILITWG